VSKLTTWPGCGHERVWCADGRCFDCKLDAIVAEAVAATQVRIEACLRLYIFPSGRSALTPPKEGETT
jgi:hypothetical protein